MKIISKINTKDLRCHHCCWTTDTLYRLEGTTIEYCGNCFSEMLVGGNFEIIPKEVVDNIKGLLKAFEE